MPGEVDDHDDVYKDVDAMVMLIDGNVDDDGQFDGDVFYVVGKFMLMLCWLTTQLFTHVPGSTRRCQL